MILAARSCARSSFSLVPTVLTAVCADVATAAASSPVTVCAPASVTAAPWTNLFPAIADIKVAEVDILKAARQAFSGLSHNLPLSK